MKECPKCHGVYAEVDSICPTCKESLVYRGGGRQTGTYRPPSVRAQRAIAGLNTKILVAIGIVIVVVGVALIIISPNLLWEEVSFSQPGVVRTTDLRTVTLLFGIVLLAVGGIVSAVGFMQFVSSQNGFRPPPSNAAQSGPPRSIVLGNTINETQLVLGQPEKIIDLGTRVIHVYKDMKIIYINGTVSDVELS